MFIDTHMHLTSKQFNRDREQVLEQMQIKNVLPGIEIPIDFDSNFLMRNEEKGLVGINKAAGIHPSRLWKLQPKPEKIIEHICRFACMDDTVAIGEIGLDHHITGTEEFWPIQETWMHHFIEIAQTEKLPVILHIRQAFDDGVRILKEHGHTHEGIVHCFSGSWEEAKQYINLGLFLGIGGMITMGNGIEEVVKKIPLDYMVLETDAPYLTPFPSTGRNTPENIPVIAEKLSKIKGICIDEIERVTTENAQRIILMKNGRK